MVNKLCERLVESIIKNANSKIYYFDTAKGSSLKYYGINSKKLARLVDDKSVLRYCEEKYNKVETCIGKLLEFCAEHESYPPAIYLMLRIIFKKPVSIEELKSFYENSKMKEGGNNV